jgi:hypothetical protein
VRSTADRESRRQRLPRAAQEHAAPYHKQTIPKKR